MEFGNKIVIASERAHKRLEEHYIGKGVNKSEIDDIIFVVDKGTEYYTEEAQDLFNKFFDEELKKLI